MAASNTKFRAENGLDVVGSANVSGSLRVEGDLAVTGNLAFNINTSGDIKPTSNIYSLGNTTARWSLNALTGDFASNVSITDTLIVNNAVAANLVPSQNNTPLGSTTRRWAAYANTIDAVTITVSANAALANATISNTLSIGSIVANQTTLSLGNTIFSVNTGSKIAVYATGNSTYSNLTLTNDVTSIAGNVAFDSDTFFIDAVNNRLGFKNTSPSTSALVTVTGNIEFSTSNTGIRLNTDTASVNASITLVANSTNSRVTFATYDNSNSSTQDGGFVFNGTNSTATQALLNMNGYQFQYKSGNVAHSGNFGIYNVSGTRVGP